MTNRMLSQWGVLVALVLFVLGAVPQAHAQYIEEQGTLESIYEARARSVLNSFLRPTEYTVVISAEVERDQKHLDDYREKLETQFLPGLPIPADPQMMPAQNELHSMKSKVELSLVLSQEVPAEKEKLLRDILTSKLHLDETTGDKITVSRASFPKDTPQKPPQILPELSWKSWTLILLLALLALAGLIYWASRRGIKAEEKEEQEDEKAEHDDFDLPEVTATAPKETDHSDDETSEDLFETKERVIALTTKYPAIASKAISELVESGQERTVVALMETLGWDQSKRLFSELGARTWGKIGSSVRTREALPSKNGYKQAFTACHRLILARVLEAGGEKDSSNPFAFLIKASAEERRQLLNREPAQNLAIVSWFCAQGELNDYFDTLDVGMQSDITLAMSRLTEMPFDAVQATAQKLVENLQALRLAPVVKAEGPKLAAQVLRSFAPEKEMAIMSRLSRDNPAEAERIRRATVLFTDLALYPADIVSAVITDLDAETVTAAFFGCDEQFAMQMFELLPKKKAMMIDRDYRTQASGIGAPSASLVGMSRRQIVGQVEASLEKSGISLEDVWSKIDIANSGVQAAA